MVDFVVVVFVVEGVVVLVCYGMYWSCVVLWVGLSVLLLVLLVLVLSRLLRSCTGVCCGRIYHKSVSQSGSQKHPR